MKAIEFVNEYEQNTDNSRQIFARLQQLGYKKLGGGVDATVWSKDEGHVIKILMPQNDREQADNAFLFFYNICKENQNNPFLPKFIDIGGQHHSVFEINGISYRQIAMERLQPIQEGSIIEAMIWGLSDLATVAFIKWKDVRKQLMSSNFWEHFPNGSDIGIKVADLLKYESSDKFYNQLFLTMQNLFIKGRASGYGWDLHTENVMQRKDGTPVITDPYMG